MSKTSDQPQETVPNQANNHFPLIFGEAIFLVSGFVRFPPEPERPDHKVITANCPTLSSGD